MTPQETIGDVEHVVTADHPPRTDSPEYGRTRKWLMGSTAGGCYVCGGPVDLSHPEDPGNAKGLQDHHGGGIFLTPATGDPVLVGTNLFGTEWSLGWGADPVRVKAFVTQLNEVTSRLGGQPYTAEIATTADVMAWVDSQGNANVKLCAHPETMVRMADGTERPIQTIRPGDEVLGGDGCSREVYATASRDYEGELVSPSEGLWLTPDHDVIRPEGWTAVGNLTVEDRLYRVDPSSDDSLGVSGGVSNIELAVVHDGVSQRHQITVAGQVVGDPWPVPVVARSLDNHVQIGENRVRHVPADGALAVVGNAKRVQSFVESQFQAGGMSPSSPSLPVVVIEPEATPRAVGRTGMLRPERLIASVAEQGSGCLSGEGVQVSHPFSVETTGPSAVRGAVATLVCPTGGNDERVAAGIAMSKHSTSDRPFAPARGNWSQVGQIRRQFYSGKVHDISIRSARSFVAAGVVIHNCAQHHIAHEDKHTPDVNGHEAVGIHNGPVPIWLGQATADWTRWDMWGGSTGTLAVGHPGDDSGTAVVLHVSPLHPDKALYAEHRAVTASGQSLVLPAHNAHARLAHAGAHRS